MQVAAYLMDGIDADADPDDVTHAANKLVKVVMHEVWFGPPMRPLLSMWAG